MSVTAQTFTSTRSVLSARARTASSVTSDAILDDFLYHDTQIAPSGLIARRARGKSRSSSFNDVTNRCTRSQFTDLATKDTPRGSGASQSRYSEGAAMVQSVDPSLMPSFLASGVPE